MDLAFKQVVFLSGVSNSFTVYAYNFGASHYATVFGPFPEPLGTNYISEYDNMVSNGQNMYGKDSWGWVSETLNPPS